MQSYMIGFVAFNLVLWIVRARVMDIAFIVHVPRVNAYDTPADPARFGIPTHVIANFEYLRHHESPKTCRLCVDRVHLNRSSIRAMAERR